MFCHQVLKHDLDVFSVRTYSLVLSSMILTFLAAKIDQLYQDEIIEVWLQSLVAPKITVQAEFTSSLINVEFISPLVEDLPFVSDDASERSKVISKLDFIENRLTILDREVLAPPGFFLSVIDAGLSYQWSSQTLPNR